MRSRVEVSCVVNIVRERMQRHERLEFAIVPVSTDTATESVVFLGFEWGRDRRAAERCGRRTVHEPAIENPSRGSFRIVSNLAARDPITAIAGGLVGRRE